MYKEDEIIGAQITSLSTTKLFICCFPFIEGNAAVLFSSLLKRSSDSFVELTDLVHKGEKQGIFTNKMPASIQQVVREENLCFMKNRDVYDTDYFRFVKKLVTKASVCEIHVFAFMTQFTVQQLCRISLTLCWGKTKAKQLPHIQPEWNLFGEEVRDAVLLYLQGQVPNEHYTEIYLQALQLGIHFLLNTYFRTKAKLR